jgi:hypothetical protein
LSTTIDGVWTVNRIYRNLYTQLVTTSNYSAIRNSHSAIHYSTYEVFSVCCTFTGCRLVTASNAVASSASAFTSLLSHNSYSSNCRPMSLSNEVCPRYLASARTAQRTSLLTALLLLRTCLLGPLPSNCRCLQSHYLATAIVQLLISQSLPSNGSTCHNMMGAEYRAYREVSNAYKILVR